MSLSIDGVWKTGVWAQTVWADGVWYEGEYIPPVVEETVSGGNWGAIQRPKRKIKLVRKLSKELKEIDEKIKKVEKTAKTETALEIKKELVELVLYEKLLYEELIREFDETAKQAISAIEKKKTENILTEIKASMEAKKTAQLLEEQDIIFAFMSFL